MSAQDLLKFIFSSMLSTILSVKDQGKPFPKEPQKFLVIRQHNQFGDMLASVSLLRAIKETFPVSYTVLLASPDNYFAIEKNPFVDEIFVFEKKRIFAKEYSKKLLKVLRQNYDAAIVPATVAISNTSCLLASFSDAKYKIGPASLSGVENNLANLFHSKIKLNWHKYPDAHVSDFILDIVRPFGINTKTYNSCVMFDEHDKKFSENFLDSIKASKENKVFGFHVGAAKPQNRWALQNFVDAITSLKQKIGFDFYFTGSNSDEEQLTFMRKHFPNAGYFLNNSIPQLAAVIEYSNLFVTNDTGVMHVAGTTNTPQISIFGPTNPFNWAPLGTNKFFLRKSELIDDVEPNDVVSLALYLLENYE